MKEAGGQGRAVAHCVDEPGHPPGPYRFVDREFIDHHL